MVMSNDTETLNVCNQAKKAAVKLLYRQGAEARAEPCFLVSISLMQILVGLNRCAD